ncbi:polycystin-2-like [Branchiostoma floridae]|uniref:Polycystin-2-like n=1 Tax=Branchiostoma floridae TaxID=7739 RepID=A0A9J7N7V2_BRAFL|nr:polycystin-2-like [Branchiostoma floridae]
MLLPRRFAFKTLLFERAVQILILAAAIFICNNERGENHYYLMRATQDIISGFNKTSTRDDFWRWCDHSLLSRLFFTTWYNGRAIEQDDVINRCTTNPGLFRIGPVRLKQLRVVPGQCRTPDTMAAIVDECNVEYSTSNEDQGNYGENWSNYTSSNTSTKSTYWRYSTQNKFFDPPLYGHLAVYWDGGYVVNLGTAKEEGERIVSYLQRHDWLDSYTRAVMVEFTVYNANVNLFLAATLLVEYSHVGLAIHWISLHPFRLHHAHELEGIWSYVTLSVNLFYAFLLLVESLTIAVRIHQMGKKCFRDVWNAWEVFAWMCSSAAVGVFCWRYHLARDALTAMHANVTGQFLSFRQVSLVDEVLWYLLAGSVFANTVRLLQLLSFSASVAMLTDVIRRSTQHVVVFSVLVMLVFLAFMFCGYLLFGATLQQFQSPLGALLTGFGMLLGSIAFNDIIQADETLGRLYIFGFVVCLLFVLMNLFVGILNDTISQVKNDRQERADGLSDLVRMIRQVLTNGGEAISEKRITVAQNDIMADLYTPQIDRLQHRVELLQRHVQELQKTFTMWEYFVSYLRSMNWQQPYIYQSSLDGYDSWDSLDYDFETVYA